MTRLDSKHQSPTECHGTMMAKGAIKHIEQDNQQRIPADIVYMVGKGITSPQAKINEVTQGSHRTKIFYAPLGTGPPGKGCHLSIVTYFLWSGNKVKYIHLPLTAFNKGEDSLLAIIIKHETGIKGMSIKNENCQDKNDNVYRRSIQDENKSHVISWESREMINWTIENPKKPH